ncbi:unnamed protein product, partial [Ectocarpus sp. 12 AP-2014]
MAGNPLNNLYIVMTIADFVGGVDDGRRCPPSRRHFLPFALISKVSFQAWGERECETSAVSRDSTVNQLDYFMDLGAPFACVCQQVVHSGKVDFIAHVHSLARCPWWNNNGHHAYSLQAVVREMRSTYY